MTNFSGLYRRLMGLCFGMGLTLLCAGLLPLLIVPALAQETPVATEETASETTPAAASTDEPIVVAKEPTGDNGYCAVCHSQPWRAVTLRDGYILNLFVPAETIANSVHGDNNPQGKLGCLDCHGEDAFPHNEPTPNNARDYTLDAVSICTECHTDSADELMAGLHEEAIVAGNRNAAVCTDCHGDHDIQSAPQQPQLVAGVCGDCHTDTLSQWQSSAHVEIGPLGCATCHSPHTQRIRAENGDTDANAVCINCHKNDTMPDLYAHDTHISDTSEVQCIDCHMHTETIGLVGTELSSHTMLLDTAPCTTCHQELVDSGRWEEITGRSDAELVAQRDELQKRIIELETEIEEQPATENDGFISTLQGLLVGLGFGITFAAVFFTRSRRGATVFNTTTPASSTSDEGTNHE